MEDIPVLKEMVQKIVNDIKEKLQEYWVNEVGLPISVQVKSMAIMDMYIENCKIGFESNQSNDPQNEDVKAPSERSRSSSNQSLTQEEKDDDSMTLPEIP